MNCLIIGGNATGMSAAAKLRRNMPDAIITVIEEGDIVSFGACGLPYYLGGEFDDANEMIARPLEDFKKNNIDILSCHQAVSLDHENKKVSVLNKKTNTTLELTYDKLLISTGAFPFVPPIEGIKLNGIHTLTKMHDGIALKELLKSAKKIVIVGGGFIGIETAEACLHQGKEVRIIERMPRLAGLVFDTEMTEHLETAIKKHKVDVHLEETVTSFKEKGNGLEVLTDKGSYDADLVIISVGFSPATSWCSKSGLEVLPNGAIIIDEKGKTNIVDIYAGGDCATIKHATFGQNSYIPLATNANKIGRVLGDVLAGKENHFAGALGSAAIRFMDFEVGRTGLSEHEAQKLNIEYSINTIKDFNYTSYVKGRSELFVKLIYDKKSRVLLGGQICGAKDAVLRVDVLALGVFKKMTVDELGMMDFIYSPPFARTWDILNVAGNTSK